MPDGNGPTANLRGYQSRSGRAGAVYLNGDLLGEVMSLEWSVEAEQVTVPIVGSYRDETKPGVETRRGSFRFKDVHDRWALLVWDFLDARRRRDRSAAAFPEFDIVTKLDDIGAPAISSWALKGCQLYSFEGGFSVDDSVMTRDVPFSFRAETPLNAFTYGKGGAAVLRQES